jgi:hypothetical protein
LSGRFEADRVQARRHGAGHVVSTVVDKKTADAGTPANSTACE